MNTKIRGVVAVAMLLCVLVACATPRIKEYDPLECASKRQKDRDLFYAVKYRNQEMVESALKKKPNVNVADKIGQTALMWACNNGDLPIITLLLDHRANVSMKSRSPHFMYNALFAFVMSPADPGNPEAVAVMKRMIAMDRRMLHMTDFFGETVIHKIARSGRPGFLDVVAAGVRPKSRDAGLLESIIEILLDPRDTKAFESLVNQKSDMQQSPLEVAVRLRRPEMVNRFVALAEGGLKISGFDDEDLPLLAFADGRGNPYVFAAVFRGRIATSGKGAQRTGDPKFLQAWNTLMDGGVGSGPSAEDMGWFSQIYDNYIGDMLPGDLLPSDLADAIDELFKLAADHQIVPGSNEYEEFFKKLGSRPRLAAALGERKPDPNPNRAGQYRTLAQIVLERQSPEAFMRLVSLVDGLGWEPMNNDYGDYLAASIVLNKREQMRFLLKRYPEPPIGLENLMGLRASLNLADRPHDPLLAFYYDTKLSDDKDLRKMVTSFYGRKFAEETYATKLLESLEDRGRFDIIRMLFTDYPFDFMKCGYKFLEPNQRPLLRIFFDHDLGDIAKDIIAYNIDKENYPDQKVAEVIMKIAPDMWQRYRERMPAVAKRWPDDQTEETP